MVKVMKKILECECNFCGGAVRFEVSKTGELINCQLCGMETILFVPGTAQPYPPEQFFLQATNIGWAKTPFGVRNVVGSVINNSDKNFDWVKIEFTLVTRDARVVGGASDCLIHFPAKGIWTFHAPVFQDEAVGVGIPLISCEYGKLWVQPALPEKPAVAAIPLPPTAPVPPRQTLQAPQAPAKPRTNEWTGLRITGGVTGSAHRPPNQ